VPFLVGLVRILMNLTELSFVRCAGKATREFRPVAANSKTTNQRRVSLLIFRLKFGMEAIGVVFFFGVLTVLQVITGTTIENAVSSQVIGDKPYCEKNLRIVS